MSNFRCAVFYINESVLILYERLMVFVDSYHLLMTDVNYSTTIFIYNVIK